MKFKFNWPCGFWENCFEYIDETPIWVTLAKKVRGQPWPLEIIYTHCLITFNISSENNDSVSNSIRKSTIEICSNLNALESEFDLDVKYAKVNVGFSFEHTW